MVSMMTAGLSIVVIFSVLIVGIYAALIPPQLEVKVVNGGSIIREVTVDLRKDGELVRHWKASIYPGKTGSFSYPLYLGGYNITVSSQGFENATAVLDMPFLTLEKSRTETFTVTDFAVAHGNVY
jgi:hypothetical protein